VYIWFKQKDTHMMLEFSRIEMVAFLTKDDVYEIRTVEYYETYSEYHNRVVDVKREMEIAYPKEIPFEKFIANKSTRTQLIEWSIESVFNKKIKTKSLEL
jgi:hypothetical protein